VHQMAPSGGKHDDVRPLVRQPRASRR
jgi:hypothetical protein